ncbi:MAG: L,D-transpeptidase family protein [Verrucomicrobia bacterium]|nr:L,D-transpeptidase family protein [Verrucomicrobiota bacterium]
MKPFFFFLTTLLVGSAALAQTPPVSPSTAPIGQDWQVAKAEPVGERELAVKLQIFLDQKNFGPGKIDGRAKEFTLKALARYEKAHGLPGTGLLEEAAKLPLESIDPIYTTYTVVEEDLSRIGDVPGKPEQQAKLKKMPYPSLLVFLAERFHSDPEFLVKINKGRDMEALKVGDTVFVPNVVPFKIENVKEVAKLPVVPEFKARRIHIDTKQKMLDLTEGEKLLASYPITPGSQALPAPAGTWKILGIATLPWFRHDEGVLNHGVRTNNFYNIPAGPTNPVGVLWCGLNRPGIGVHGTNQPFTIGRAGSHGCIRLANWDAIRLSAMITEGMTVVIDDGIPVPKPGETPAEQATQKPPLQVGTKVSSNPALTLSAQTATKNAPQNPGRETKYANH